MVIENLQALREAACIKPGAAVQGRKLQISPGKSTSAHDLAIAEPSGPPQKRTRTQEPSPSDSEINRISSRFDPDSIEADDPEAIKAEANADEAETVEAHDYIMVKSLIKKKCIHQRCTKRKVRIMW